MGCGASVVAFDAIDENIKLKNLRKTVQAARDKLETGETIGAAAQDELRQLEVMLQTKERLAIIVDAKTSAKDYIPVDPLEHTVDDYRDALALWKHVRNRCRDYRIMNLDERQKLDTRLGILQRLTNARMQMIAACATPVSSGMAVAQLKSIIGDVYNVAYTGAVQANDSLNLILTSTKMGSIRAALGRADPRLTHLPLVPEYAMLRQAIYRTEKMWRHKVEMVEAEQQGRRAIHKDTSLKDTQAAFDRMEAALENAVNCYVDDAPELPPLEQCIDSLDPILDLKQEVSDSVTTPFIHCSVDDLRGAVTARMEEARDLADSQDAYGGPEKIHLERQLEILPAIADGKELCDHTAALEVQADMTFQQLREIRAAIEEAVQELRNAVSQAVSQPGCDQAPEYTAASQRSKDVQEIIDAKQEMLDAVKEGRITFNTDEAVATAMWNRMVAMREHATTANLKSFGLAKMFATAPEFKALLEHMNEVKPIVDAKRELVAAINEHHDDLAAQSTYALKGHLRQALKAAENNAKENDAFGGAEVSRLTRRYEQLEQVAEAKRTCKEALVLDTGGELNEQYLRKKLDDLSKIEQNAGRQFRAAGLNKDHMNTSKEYIALCQLQSNLQQLAKSQRDLANSRGQLESASTSYHNERDSRPESHDEEGKPNTWMIKTYEMNLSLLERALRSAEEKVHTHEQQLEACKSVMADTIVKANQNLAEEEAQAQRDSLDLQQQLENQRETRRLQLQKEWQKELAEANRASAAGVDQQEIKRLIEDNYRQQRQVLDVVRKQAVASQHQEAQRKREHRENQKQMRANKEDTERALKQMRSDIMDQFEASAMKQQNQFDLLFEAQKDLATQFRDLRMQIESEQQELLDMLRESSASGGGFSPGQLQKLERQMNEVLKNQEQLRVGQKLILDEVMTMKVGLEAVRKSVVNLAQSSIPQFFIIVPDSDDCLARLRGQVTMQNVEDFLQGEPVEKIESFKKKMTDSFGAIKAIFNSSSPKEAVEAAVDVLEASALEASSQRKARLFLIDMYTWMPVEGHGGYPLKKPRETVSKFLPLMAATAKALKIANGACAVARTFFGWPFSIPDGLIKETDKLCKSLDMQTEYACVGEVLRASTMAPLEGDARSRAQKMSEFQQQEFEEFLSAQEAQNKDEPHWNTVLYRRLLKESGQVVWVSQNSCEELQRRGEIDS